MGPNRTKFLANRRLQPLGHLSGSNDYTGKLQIAGFGKKAARLKRNDRLRRFPDFSGVERNLRMLKARIWSGKSPRLIF
jgi:hypothetical protein